MCIVLITLRKVLQSKDIIDKFATVTITATSKFFRGTRL
jgi:hypothetical protein